MSIKALFTASLLAFITPSASGELPNLCDAPYLDESGAPFYDSTGLVLARYCEWTGPDAPQWNDALCCSLDESAAKCVPKTERGCDFASQVAMWCEHGERLADGSVSCYQPLPSACDFMPCFAPPAGTPPLEHTVPLCCLPSGFCWEPSHEMGGECEGGKLSYCTAPYTNPDGTVGCGEDD